MADQPCPNCGEPLAGELGQHALTPTSGSESIDGVIDELSEQEGGPG